MTINEKIKWPLSSRALAATAICNIIVCGSRHPAQILYTRFSIVCVKFFFFLNIFHFIVITLRRQHYILYTLYRYRTDLIVRCKYFLRYFVLYVVNCRRTRNECASMFLILFCIFCVSHLCFAVLWFSD